MKIKVDTSKLHLNKVTKGLSNVKKITEKVGNEGLMIAQNRVPVWSGLTQQGITFTLVGDEGWLLSRELTDRGKPVNVLIEKGDWQGLVWGPGTMHPSKTPITGEFHFMENTAKDLEIIYPEQVNIYINGLLA
jgi:hypothetical protein